MLNFDLAKVQQLATTHRVIPLIDTLFSTSETPLSVFEKLAANKEGGFLLESAEQGVWARYSFVGVNSRGYLIQEPGEQIAWRSAAGHRALPSELPLDTVSATAAIEQVRSAWTSAPLTDLPPLVSGLVGTVGWDLIREIENLQNQPQNDFNAPIVCLSMFSELVVLDHHTGSLQLVSNIFLSDNADVELAFKDAKAKLAELRDGLNSASQPFIAELVAANPEYRAKTSKDAFLKSVETAREYIKVGDVFQVVISQRFDADVTASPLDVYRVLRSLNPSPYMYLLNLSDSRGEFSVVGASPEALVTVKQGHAVTHPIAGSRPRGASIDEDVELGESLQQDEKEKAEHLMLVDLARNDLLKVCNSGSLRVSEFMQLHRYSHVMHLVSTVEGELRDGMSPVDAFRATFPAGTLSGAPKPRALEIIDELEPAGRGAYGGVVGYFDFSGNADLAIAIRTAFIRDGVAHVQAGAGLVLDSIAESEWQECINKASAPLRAIATANAMRKVHHR
ncbi:MAG: chorismate-binding protein [Micrococcales bacterium]